MNARSHAHTVQSAELQTNGSRMEQIMIIAAILTCWSGCWNHFRLKPNSWSSISAVLKCQIPSKLLTSRLSDSLGYKIPSPKTRVHTISIKVTVNNARFRANMLSTCWREYFRNLFYASTHELIVCTFRVTIQLIIGCTDWLNFVDGQLDLTEFKDTIKLLADILHGVACQFVFLACALPHAQTDTIRNISYFTGCAIG